MEIKDKLDSWIALDMLDFEGIMCDATKWEDGTYTVTLNMFTYTGEDDENPLVDPDSKEIAYKGLTLYTQIDGENLHELHQKLTMLMMLGFFNNITVSGHGTLWDHEGNEIGEIEWADYQAEFSEDYDDTNTEVDHGALFSIGSKKLPTIH